MSAAGHPLALLVQQDHQSILGVTIPILHSRTSAAEKSESGHWQMRTTDGC